VDGGVVCLDSGRQVRFCERDGFPCACDVPTGTEDIEFIHTQMSVFGVGFLVKGF